MATTTAVESQANEMEPETDPKAPNASRNGLLKATADALQSKLGVDAATAMRFSTARSGDPAAAEAFLAADLEWRRNFRPEALAQSDAPTALPSGSMRLLLPAGGSAAPPVLLCSLELWNAGDYGADEYERYVAYFMERVCAGGGRFVAVLDVGGWRPSHAIQMKKTRMLVKTLQDHYPERLECALLMRAPGIFAGAWRIIRKFLDPETARKIRFVGGAGGEEEAALRELRIWEVIPKYLSGGRAAYVPVPNFPGEPNVEGAPDVGDKRPP